MNYSFISVFLPILIAGILIHKLLEAKISRIIQRQKGVVTTKSGEDVLREIFGEDVKIKRLEKSKGLGGEAYDPDQEEFSLTEEIGTNNTAAKTIGYLLTIERLNRRSYGTTFIIGRVLQAFLTLLALVYLPILFFSDSTALLYSAIVLYIMLMALNLVYGGWDVRLSRTGLRNFLWRHKVLLEESDESSLNEYLGGLRMQAFFLAPFNPILVPYFTAELFVKKVFRLRRGII